MKIQICEFCRKPATAEKPLLCCEKVHPPIIHHPGCRGPYAEENGAHDRWAMGYESRAVLG